MIRKPGAEDFRESTAVTAVRETGKIAVEGSRGIGQGFSRLLLYWFGFVTVVGLITSVAGEFGIGALFLFGGGAMWWYQDRKARAAARMAALRRTPDSYLEPARPQPPIVGDVAFPPEVRRHGRVELDIGAVVQRAAVLFGAGFVIMILFARGDAGIAMTVGIFLVMLAVLIASRVFGDRTVLAWDTRTVTVQHIFGKGTMQWADIVDVSVIKASRLDLRTFCQTGSRRNIVLRAQFNRLGGPSELKVPIRLLGMEQVPLEALLRDLFCWRAAGNSLASCESTSPAPAYDAMPANPAHLAPGPDSDPRHSFDADAIIARHLREREELVRVTRPDLVTTAGIGRPPMAAAGGRPVFGRKVAQNG